MNKPFTVYAGSQTIAYRGIITKRGPVLRLCPGICFDRLRVQSVCKQELGDYGCPSAAAGLVRQYQPRINIRQIWLWKQATKDERGAMEKAAHVNVRAHKRAYKATQKLVIDIKLKLMTNPATFDELAPPLVDDLRTLRPGIATRGSKMELVSFSAAFAAGLENAN